MKKIILDKNFAGKLLDQTKLLYDNNSALKEKDGLKAKLHGIETQLDALAERLTQLPKSVSGKPFFKQMEKLEAGKIEIEEKLFRLKDTGQIQDPSVALKTYEAFRESLKILVNDGFTGDTKMALIRRLVHKVRVKPDGIEIEYYMGERYFEMGLVGDSTGSKLFILNIGSNNLTIGAP